jgi:hypothetical protein
MDLPAVVRIMIYEQIFDHDDMTRDGIKLKHVPHIEFYNGRSDLKEIADIMKVLSIFSTLNTTICKEAHITFRSLAAFELRQNHLRKKTDNMVSTPYHMAIVEHFLRGLEDDGRSVIKSLVTLNFTGCHECGIPPLDLTGAGQYNFMRVYSFLRSPTSLSTLRISISDHYLFRDDQAALEYFFLRGEVLKSEGLMAFQKTLQGLPELLNVSLDVPGTNTDGDPRIFWHGLTLFFRVAFTDGRRYKLWNAAAEIRQGTKLQLEAGRIHVASTPDRSSETSGPQTSPSLKSGEEEWAEWQQNHRGGVNEGN